MARIRVGITIHASPQAVWADVRDLSTHPEWMADAVAIRFVSAHREGVGTVFDCDTKVGPFRLTDRMEVVSWRSGEEIGIRHGGVVTGEGRFTLRGAGVGRTRFTWEERVRFPWWLGGPAGAWIGGLVLRPIWGRNLRRLAARFDG